MRAIVTRPLAQAAAWVADLQAHGIDAVALPLIAIDGAPDPDAVHAAWRSLEHRRLVVFVSPNAALAFFDLRPADVAWPAATRAASPGPGTTRALVDLGVPAAAIDAPAADAAQFDSEALWKRLAGHDWNGASVLVVRGVQGRDWLAARLGERGARVDDVAAYARVVPTLDAATRRALDDALHRPRDHVWLFSSAEAIGHLASLANAAATPEPRWSDGIALATHPRIAARARALGFGSVHEASPTLPAVVACIQSIRP